MPINLNKATLPECFPAERGRRLALIGAGGKSTTMLRLAGESQKTGRPVALTTTTEIFRAQARGPVLAEFNRGKNHNLPDTFTLAQPVEDSEEEEPLKLTEPGTSNLTALLRNFPGRILIEADGAAGAKLKIHRDFEPVIPEPLDAVLSLFDLSVLDENATEENIHYWPLWKENFGGQRKVTHRNIEKLFELDDGYLNHTDVEHWLGLVHPPTPEAGKLSECLAGFSESFWEKFDRRALLSGELSYEITT